jgi:CubicO group peptidase (beta-lactamase class C family)
VQEQVAAGAMVYSPAEKWKYSNFGYTILGEVIKVASGVPYEAYVNEHIVGQLGLSHTAPTLTDAIVENLATGYSRDIPGHARERFPLIETHVMAPATGFSSIFDGDGIGIRVDSPAVVDLTKIIGELDVRSFASKRRPRDEGQSACDDDDRSQHIALLKRDVSSRASTPIRTPPSTGPLTARRR